MRKYALSSCTSKHSMKKLLPLLLLICHFQLSAQNGFFIQASGGAGFMKSAVETGSAIYNNKQILSYNSGLLLGYSLNHFILKTGIAYFNATYFYPGTFNDKGLMPPFEVYPNYAYYNYLALPLSVAYNIKINKRLSISPYLGYSLGFAQNKKRDFLAPISKTITSQLSSTNSFASIQFELAYQLTSKLYLSLAPDIQRMYPSNENMPNTFYGLSTSYTYTLNIGIKYYLSHQYKNVKPAKEANAPKAAVENK